MPGINNGDGDNWGTWGGYHNWDLSTIKDEADEWALTAWLTDGAAFGPDNCPQQQLTADLAIRKPQGFLPLPGTPINWQVLDLATQSVLQNDFTLVRPNGLIVLNQVVVYRGDIRKVRIQVTFGSSTDEAAGFPESGIQPNPAGDFARLQLTADRYSTGELQVLTPTGVSVVTQYPVLEEGINQLDLPLQHLPPGLYFVRLTAGEKQGVWRLVKH